MNELREAQTQLEHCDHTIANLRKNCARLRGKLERAETIANRCIVGLGDILAKRGAAPLTAIHALKMGKKWQEEK